MMTAAMPRDAADGEQRKCDAHALLAARRKLHVLRGRRALLVALLERGEATADDVRRAVPLPDGIGPKLFGAVPGELVRAEIIAPDGWIPTERPEGHARPVQRWMLRDRDAALAWIREHADQPAPVDDRADGSERTLWG